MLATGTVAAICCIAVVGSMPGLQVHFAPVVGGLHVGNARHLTQHAHRRGLVERFDADDPPIELPPQAGHRLVEHLPAVVDHDHVLAELLGVRHDVRREEDRGTALLLGRHEILQQPDADRVEAAERLVENDQLGPVDDGRNELDAVEHPLRQLLTLLLLDVDEPDARQQLLRARQRLVRGHALELRDVGEEVANAHPAVDAALFRQVADAILGLERRRVTEHRQLPRIGEEDRHDHPDARRLAGAARTDESVGRAARHDQIELVDRARRAECLRQALKAQRWFHQNSSFRGCYSEYG